MAQVQLLPMTWCYTLKRFCDQGPVLHRSAPDGSPACGVKFYACGGQAAAEDGPHCRKCERLRKYVVYVRAHAYAPWCAYYRSKDREVALTLAQERAAKYPNDDVALFQPTETANAA